MKIAVDCHVMAGKFQGSRTYLENLYSHVLQLDHENEYVFLGHWGEDRPFGPAQAHTEYNSKSRLHRLSYGSYGVLKSIGGDLIHSTYISPLLTPCPQLLTVHDLLFETHPQYFERGFVQRSRLFVRYSARRASAIHTISSFTKSALIDIYDIPEEKISVVPVGVNLTRFSQQNKESSVRHVSNQYGVRDYVLSVGRLEPRKNYPGLLQAYSQYRRACPQAGPLVIVGQRDFRFNAIFDAIATMKLEKHVMVLDNVGNDSLISLYQAARMFVYPSFAEGFGIPPLEAMACGVPVIASDCTAIPEVVGDCGILVDPHKPELIAEAMIRLENDEHTYRSLSHKGVVQARNWSWRNAGKAYLKAVLGRSCDVRCFANPQTIETNEGQAHVS